MQTFANLTHKLRHIILNYICCNFHQMLQQQQQYEQLTH